MESLRVTVPEIWPGQNRGKNKKKNNEANWMVSNSAKLDRRTKQHTQFGVSASNGSRDMARTRSWQKKEKKKEKNNKANWMVSNSAKLDCRTKQHTGSRVSTSDGSRDMARTRSWRKKKKKKEKRKKINSRNPIKHPLQGSLIIIIIMIIITRPVLGRPVCDRGAISENEKLYASYFAAFQL